MSSARFLAGSVTPDLILLRLPRCPASVWCELRSSIHTLGYAFVNSAMAKNLAPTTALGTIVQGVRGAPFPTGKTA